MRHASAEDVAARGEELGFAVELERHRPSEIAASVIDSAEQALVE